MAFISLLKLFFDNTVLCSSHEMLDYMTKYGWNMSPMTSLSANLTDQTKQDFQAKLLTTV